MHFLAKSPEHRRQLIEQPDLINSAVDEITRRFGIVGQGRRIMKDTELSGVSLRKGGMIWAPTWMYGMDDSIVRDPLTVDFEPLNPPQMTFGGVPNVCAGMHLAKRECESRSKSGCREFLISGSVAMSLLKRAL